MRQKLGYKWKNSYRSGAEGFAEWCEDNVCIPVYLPGDEYPTWTPIKNLPEKENRTTGRSYKQFWERQKEEIAPALEMRDGRFIHTLIILCWMRGEGKSFLACLIQLWKFFCFPRQQIMLGANSRDQVKFVHYDIMRDIILNSPMLLQAIGGKKNIQEKEIRLKDGRSNVVSIIRSISSFSGIVSNITGYTFSEMFDMKNPKFFHQLDGSIRNIPNALGVIDSTVSEKTHVLYKLYQSWIRKKTKTVFFSYRSSKTGDYTDFWHPNMTKDQLDDYKEKFLEGEFAKYFKNLWSAGTIRVFTEEMISEMGVMGCKGGMLNHTDIRELTEKEARLIETSREMRQRDNMGGVMDASRQLADVQKHFTYVTDYYTLRNQYSQNKPITLDELNTLGNALDTRWAICAGIDFSDPMAVKGQARTMYSLVAKGLPGSRSRRSPIEEASPMYIYCLLRLAEIPKGDLDSLKAFLEEDHEELQGIDMLCSERFGSWDISKWADGRDIPFESIYPTYDRQRDAFKAMYTALDKGLFKAPPIGILGSKDDDILREELRIFDHDPDRKWFGSPEKYEKYGVQDDSIYSIAWAMYGGRMLGSEDFRVRGGRINFGFWIPNSDLAGAY